jgi:hypothetical protein
MATFCRRMGVIMNDCITSTHGRQSSGGYDAKTTFRITWKFFATPG